MELVLKSCFTCNSISSRIKSRACHGWVALETLEAQHKEWQIHLKHFDDALEEKEIAIHLEHAETKLKEDALSLEAARATRIIPEQRRNLMKLI